jgi:predicted TIM-barrel fold metal-dependent hydrolase
MSTDRCQPARRMIKPPKVKAPPGAVDCHFHIFSPDARYPYAEPRGYTPPEPLIPQYEAMIAALGIERMVIVHPSVYGTDNRCSLDAMAAFGRDDGELLDLLTEWAPSAAIRRKILVENPAALYGFGT